MSPTKFTVGMRQYRSLSQLYDSSQSTEVGQVLMCGKVPVLWFQNRRAFITSEYSDLSCIVGGTIGGTALNYALFVLVDYETQVHF